jgi:hypothetical protein
MNIGQTFKITYYAKKHGKHITRQGKWTEKCIERLDKLGNDIMIYFDMDADGYRTATKSWKVRFNDRL